MTLILSAYLFLLQNTSKCILFLNCRQQSTTRRRIHKSSSIVPIFPLLTYERGCFFDHQIRFAHFLKRLKVRVFLLQWLWSLNSLLRGTILSLVNVRLVPAIEKWLQAQKKRQVPPRAYIFPMDMMVDKREKLQQCSRPNRITNKLRWQLLSLYKKGCCLAYFDGRTYEGRGPRICFVWSILRQ